MIASTVVRARRRPLHARPRRASNPSRVWLRRHPRQDLFDRRPYRAPGCLCGPRTSSREGSTRPIDRQPFRPRWSGLTARAVRRNHLDRAHLQRLPAHRAARSAGARAAGAATRPARRAAAASRTAGGAAATGAGPAAAHRPAAARHRAGDFHLMADVLFQFRLLSFQRVRSSRHARTRGTRSCRG